jgi:hypothetical protein
MRLNQRNGGERLLMVTEQQLEAELRLKDVNTLIAESIGELNNSSSGLAIEKVKLNLVKMRVLTGALKEDIKLLG